MVGYLFVFHFIRFCSDGEKQINNQTSEQNIIKKKKNKYPTIRAKCNKMNNK
jgi:hypothetical protein